MAFVAADWSIATDGDIRYIGDAHGGGSPSYCTTLEFHRALQDFADDASSSGDDLLDITDPNPTDKKTDNFITLLGAYNIDQTASEHIYDGSIVQAGGDQIYDGIVVYGNATNVILHQSGAVFSNDFWNTGSGGLNPDATQGISHRFMVLTRTGGADIDGRRLLGLQRDFNTVYTEFLINGTSRGNNVLALTAATDLNNATAAGTVAGWTSIVNVEGYQTIDLNNGNGAQPYYSQWDLGTQGINDLYERGKWIQRFGTSETIHGINGELFRGITHEWDYDAESGGPFAEDEILSWGTGATAGTGLLLALLDSGTTGTMWIQLLSGVAPVNDLQVTGGTSSATCDVNGSVTTRTVSAAFVGQSTGSAIIGAFGIGVQAADLTVADKLFDLTNTQQQPPNQQSFTVSGVVVGEDRVLVGPNDGADEIDFDQLTAAGAQTAGAGTFVVNEAIPADTPASGTIRVFNGTQYDRVPYSSWATSTFTLTGTLPSNVANNANCFVSYIDKLATATSESFTAIYASDRSLLVRVRSGSTPGSEIKEFLSPATFSAAGGSISAIRTSDV
jgi:hypothetical protein